MIQPWILPANSSRIFSSVEEAKSVPNGKMELGYKSVGSPLTNLSYDSSLIQYDDSYCTTVASLQEAIVVPTISYFDQVLRKLPNRPRIVDIGCGRGEFVDVLNCRGIESIGYDPIAPNDSPNLRRKLWDGDEDGADLYVMRCVLPHIENPWDFIESIRFTAPEALVLIEFQRLEWILENKLWYSFMHDHVNYFSDVDFVKRYEVVLNGTFSSGEWGYVLIKTEPKATIVEDYAAQKIEYLHTLVKSGQNELEKISTLNSPVIVWGGAGKGTVLSAALSKWAPDILVVDADSNRWNKYLELSGIRVISPYEAVATSPNESLVLVCNPNHLNDVRKYIGGKFLVTLPSLLINH